MPMVESPRVASPDPLPHPYRELSPRVATSEDDSTDDDTTESEGPLSPLAIDKDMGSDKEKDGSSVVGDLQSIPRPPLVRRRSSLKQSNGSSRASLNVAWAMDQEWQDQIKRYEDAAAEAEQADLEWTATKNLYEEELMGMKDMRQNLSLTLEKLRLETERLEQEEVVMREQEGKLRDSYKQLQESQTRYRTKVQTVLNETKGVLNICQSKRV